MAANMAANRIPNRTSTGNSTSTRIGKLELGKTYHYSGSVGNGETDTYRFKIGSAPGRNALTLDSSVQGSLESITLLDRQGNFPTGANISATVSSSISSNGKGRISNTFTGIAPGTYFLRLKSAGTGENAYSFRLKYVPAEPSMNLSRVSDRFPSLINFTNPTQDLRSNLGNL